MTVLLLPKAVAHTGVGRTHGALAASGTANHCCHLTPLPSSFAHKRKRSSQSLPVCQATDKPAPQQEELSDPVEKLNEYGDRAAASQEAALLQAQQELQSAPPEQPPSAPARPSSSTFALRTPPGSSAAQAAQNAAAKARTASTASSDQPSPQADILARINKAKAYKKGPSKPSASTDPSGNASTASQSSQQSPPGSQQAPQQQQQQQVASVSEQQRQLPLDSFSASQRSSSAAASQPQDQPGGAAVETQQYDIARPAADEAAPFLQDALKRTTTSEQPSDAAQMRPEMFSLLKEQEMRKQTAEIISVDKNYKAGQSVMDPGYKPKVATWGMFPRPQNISETYGGGRNIRPGAPLESEEQTAARKARVAEALQRYKYASGTVIDPAVEAQCQAAFDEGQSLLQQGLVAAALQSFTTAADQLPVKTALGGRARLQKAICLDSLARSKEAYAVYRQIENHPTGEVAKQAKRMIFGFRAMENLKTYTISYDGGVSKGAYQKYFNRLSGDWNAAYVSTDTEEDKKQQSVTTAFATAVMLAPFVFLGSKVLPRLLH